MADKNNQIVKKENYTDGGKFQIKIGGTTFKVGVFFDKENPLTLDDRVKNLIKKDVESGNY